MKILIIEDEKELASDILHYLSGENLIILTKEEYDLLLFFYRE
jgi:DNA-binding response OmpR family regulator